MNINFELYKIFYVVASNKSITKGAEKLLISQPAVTQAIKNLEGQLNTTLFIRTKKGIVLTEEGKELFNYVQEGMNYFINGTNKLLQLKNLETGIIKIGASTSITENYLMPYIKEFHKLYPKIEIKITNQLTDTLLQELRNGSLDVVIGGEPFKENKDLLFSPLREIEYIFISNQKLDLPFDHILNEKLILQTLPSVTRTTFDNFLKENNFTCNIGMEVVSHKLVADFVKSGMGIGFAVKQYLSDDLNDQKLYEIKTTQKLPNRKIGFLIKKDFVPSYAVKAFIDILNS